MTAPASHGSNRSYEPRCIEPHMNKCQLSGYGPHVLSALSYIGHRMPTRPQSANPGIASREQTRRRLASSQPRPSTAEARHVPINVFAKSVEALVQQHGCQVIAARRIKLEKEEAALQSQLRALTRLEHQLMYSAESESNQQSDLDEQMKELTLRLIHAKFVLEGIQCRTALLRQGIADDRRECYEGKKVELVRQYERRLVEDAVKQRRQEWSHGAEEVRKRTEKVERAKRLIGRRTQSIQQKRNEECRREVALGDMGERLMLMSAVVSEAIGSSPQSTRR